MDFHDFPTIYGTLKRNGLVEESPNRFYPEAIALLRVKAAGHHSHAVAVENNRSVCEWDWMRLGSPYFKLWPAVLPLLSNVNNRRAVDYLRLPFKAFVIRLPAEDNPLAIDQQYFVRSILVSEGQPEATTTAESFSGSTSGNGTRGKPDPDLLPT